MANYPPDHCPRCGAGIEDVDAPTIFYCPECEDYTFHNPYPSARVLVLRDEEFLFVRQGQGPVGKWLTPGGAIECGNQPAEHAAIELQEETNLSVDPADLVLFDASAVEPAPERYVVSLVYAVEYERCAGEIEAGSDAAEARFWTMAEFEDADQNGYPGQVEYARRLLDQARPALADARRHER